MSDMNKSTYIIDHLIVSKSFLLSVKKLLYTIEYVDTMSEHVPLSCP